MQKFFYVILITSIEDDQLRLEIGQVFLVQVDIVLLLTGVQSIPLSNVACGPLLKPCYNIDYVNREASLCFLSLFLEDAVGRRKLFLRGVAKCTRSQM